MNAIAIQDEHDDMMQSLYTEALLRIRNHSDVIAAIRALEQEENS